MPEILTDTNHSQILVTRGADVNSRGRGGLTPIMWAVKQSKNRKLMEYLYKNGTMQVVTTLSLALFCSVLDYS